MPVIKFTVTDEAAAYLRWFARNVLFESNDLARHTWGTMIDAALVDKEEQDI